MIEHVRIIQHNIIKWTAVRGNELANTYKEFNPDIILINATGKKDNEKIKLFNYNVYQRNITGEDHAGIAVAIKKNIVHKLIDDTNEDILVAEMETNKGPVIICYSLYSTETEGILTQ